MTRLGPLRLIYTGSSDVEADTRFHVTQLGGELRFYLHRFGATVASVRHGDGPDVLFASHLRRGETIYFHEVADIAPLTQLSSGSPVETPIGQAVLFSSETGHRFGGIEISKVDFMEKAWRTPGHEGAVRPAWFVQPPP
ncbi:MAG: hypothetical protein AAGE65_07370 [Planctomycetota bacterium]